MSAPTQNARDTLARLHEFGALIAYQVRYLNQITRTIDSMELSHRKEWTFNEEVAKAACESLKQSGVDAWVVSVMIGFDGAWDATIAP